MSARALLITAVALFAVTVLVRAPARWALAALPAGVSCPEPSGSVWHGGCAQLSFAGVQLEGIRWRAHAWPLLRGHFDLDLHSDDARAPGSAHLSLAVGGSLSLQDLRADLPVDAGLLPMFPSGWSGQLQLALPRVEFSGGRLIALQGTATARSLAQRNPPMPFGSFELRFDEPAESNGVISGALRDLGGPLAVSGRLQIRNGSEYELSGLAATRPEASADLLRLVEVLGPADAQGRRPFSVAGAF